MASYASNSTFKLVLLVATCISRLGTIGALLCAIVVVAATNAGKLATGSSRQVIDTLAAFAPLYAPNRDIVSARDIVLLFIAIGSILLATLVGGWHLAVLNKIAGWLGSVLIAAAGSSQSHSVESFKATITQTAERGHGAYMTNTTFGDARISFSSRLLGLQAALRSTVRHVAACGAFLPPLVAALHITACSIPPPDPSAAIHSWTESHSTAYAGAQLLGVAPGECLGAWAHWAVLAAAVAGFVAGISAAAVHRLQYPHAPGCASAVPGGTLVPLHAVLHDAWDCATAAACILLLPVLPLGYVVLLLCMGQAIVLYHCAVHVSAPRVWQWGLMLAWHAVRLALCTCALLIVATSGGAFHTVDGVLLFTGVACVLSGAVALLAAFWFAASTGGERQSDLAGARRHLLWLTQRMQSLAATNHSSVKQGWQHTSVVVGVAAAVSRGLKGLRRIANQGPIGSGVAVEALLYASALHRAWQQHTGGTWLPELLDLQELLKHSQRFDVKAFVRSRVQCIQDDLVSQQLGSNDTAKSVLLSSAMQHIAVCLGAQAVVWQSLSRPELQVQVDVLHDAAAELYTARQEVEGILEFMTTRPHLVSADVLHVQAFYLQHILQLSDAAAQAQANASAMERRAMFDARHGAADGADDGVDVSLSVHELLLFQEPPSRALGTGFRAAALLRNMYQGTHAKRAGPRHAVVEATEFDYGLLLLSLPSGTEGVGQVLQLNDFAAYLLGLRSADEAVGGSVAQFLPPCLARSIMGALHDRDGSRAHTVSPWLDRPLLLPLVQLGGQVQFVFASATVAPPALFEDASTGDLTLQSSLLVRLLPVSVVSLAYGSVLQRPVHGSLRQTQPMANIDWLPQPLHHAAIQVMEGAIRLAPARQHMRSAAVQVPHRAQVQQGLWMPAHDSTLHAVSVPTNMACTTVDVMLLALGQQTCTAQVEEAASRTAPLLAALDRSAVDSDGEHMAGSDGDSWEVGSDGSRLGELRDSFEQQFGLARQQGSFPPPKPLKASTPGAVEPAVRVPAADAANSSSSAIFRLALSSYTLRAFKLNVKFKKAVVFGLTVTSVLFIWNLLPATIRPETLRFSQAAGLRSSMLLSSSVLPASALHLARLRATPWLWLHQPCPPLDFGHEFVSNCSFADPRDVSAALARHDVAVASHVLREMQRLDQVLFGTLEPTEEPRLTQPDAHAVVWPSQSSSGQDHTSSAEGVWSRYIVHSVMQAHCWSELSGSCSHDWLPPASIEAVGSAMQSVELALRKHMGQDIQISYILNTAIIMVAGIVMAAAVAAGAFWFGWRVNLKRRWLFRSLLGVPRVDAAQLYTGVTQLYDAIVYGSGSLGEEEASDEEGDTIDGVRLQNMPESLCTALSGPAVGLPANGMSPSGSARAQSANNPSSEAAPLLHGRGQSFNTLGSAGLGERFPASPGAGRISPAHGTPSAVFSRSMRLSSGGTSPLRGARRSPLHRSRRLDSGSVLGGSRHLDSGSVFEGFGQLGGSVLGSRAARSRVGMSSVVSRRMGGMLAGSPGAARSRAGSVMSNTQRSVTSKHSSQMASKVLTMGAMNMSAFRTSADTSTMHIGARGDSAHVGHMAHGGQKRKMTETWRYFWIVLAFMVCMLLLLVVNVSLFVGVSVWHRSNIFNSEARIFLMQSSAGLLKQTSSALMGALIAPSSVCALCVPPSEAADSIKLAAQVIRDNIRLLSEGGTVQYLEHATLLGASNYTRAVPAESPLGRLLFSNACTAPVLGFEPHANMQHSELVLAGEIPASISASVLHTAHSYQWHAGQCAVVEHGALTEGLQAGLALYSSLATAAAGELLASAANLTSACPLHVLHLAHDEDALANRGDISSSQAASCRTLAGLAARAVRLETLHLSVALQQAVGMDFVDGLNSNLQWNIIIMWYSMLLPIVNVLFVLSLPLPLFQSLLQDVVADQLLLTTLPQSLRDTPSVKQRVNPVLQHILQENRL